MLPCEPKENLTAFYFIKIKQHLCYNNLFRVKTEMSCDYFYVEIIKILFPNV